MKKVILISALFAMTFMVGNTVFAQTEEVEEKDYCAEYVFDNDAARGKGVGESRDRQIARMEARTEALEELASKIQVTVKMYAQMFKASMKFNDEESVAGVTAKISEQIVNQKLQYKTVCEKATSYYDARKTKKYKCYMAVEVKKEEAEKMVYDQLSAEGALKAGFAYTQFKQQYDQVWEKEAQNEAVED